MIIVENISKTYSSGAPALNGVDLRVERGEFVFVVGNSGSGKSTLIKLLLKELEPTTGKIYVNKKFVNKITRKRLPMLRRDIGVVFQDFRLLTDRNVLGDKLIMDSCPIYLNHGGKNDNSRKYFKNIFIRRSST